jgi:hypothetical protein
MSYLKIFIGIFVALAVTRFIPHPPNFTSLIALSFYAPVIFGARFIPAIVLSFIVTDLYFGFHGTTLFTWGSVILIGLFSKNMSSNFIMRLFGSFLAACLFYLLTNFGVWLLGSYGYSLNGLVASYTMAIPFFVSTIISTIAFALLVEFFIKLKNTYFVSKFEKNY